VSVTLTVTGLSAGYSGFRILDGFDLDLAAGRITAIVGSNGAGKSTLLKALAGLLPRGRRATLGGQVLPPGSATAAVRAGLILVAEEPGESAPRVSSGRSRSSRAWTHEHPRHLEGRSSTDRSVSRSLSPRGTSRRRATAESRASRDAATGMGCSRRA
jgi:ABC-type cobalamin/Fe3+-siderophores transport system ATPase subunit